MLLLYGIVFLYVKKTYWERFSMNQDTLYGEIARLSLCDRRTYQKYVLMFKVKKKTTIVPEYFPNLFPTTVRTQTTYAVRNIQDYQNLSKRTLYHRILCIINYFSLDCNP